MKTVNVRTYQGVVYFPTYETAHRFGVANVDAPYWLSWRCVYYERGWAVQLRKSGDYLGPDGRPSMETAMRRFDAAGRA